MSEKQPHGENTPDAGSVRRKKRTLKIFTANIGDIVRGGLTSDDKKNNDTDENDADEIGPARQYLKSDVLEKHAVDIALLQEVPRDYFVAERKPIPEDMKDGHIWSIKNPRFFDGFTAYLGPEKCRAVILRRNGIGVEFKPMKSGSESGKRHDIMIAEINNTTILVSIHVKPGKASKINFMDIADMLNGVAKEKKDMIIGGDFNCVVREEDRVVRTGGSTEKNKYLDEQLLTKYNLTDIYPKGSKPIFTEQFARLIRVYVSENLEACVTARKTVPYTYSDHKAVLFTLKGFSIKCHVCKRQFDENENEMQCSNCHERAHITCSHVYELEVPKLTKQLCNTCFELLRKPIDFDKDDALVTVMEGFGKTCAVCGDSVQDTDNKIICSDLCKRRFHTECLTVGRPPVGKEMTYWSCNRGDCKTISDIKIGQQKLLVKGE